MSIDLYLEIPEKCPHCGGLEPGRGLTVFDRNITHNLTPMWRKANVYDALYMSHGKRAGDFLQDLEEGLTDMLEHFQDYKKLDSPNGWGLAEHACAFLWAVVKAVRRNPDCIFNVSK